jgi:hypothetical protein
MMAEEAVSLLSVMWQCENLHNTGNFIVVRGGIEMPVCDVWVNPLSFPAQQRAYAFLFGELSLTPEAMASEIETWIDPAVCVKFAP